MPRGPRGEKRPADTIADAVHVMRVATGEAEENNVNHSKAQGGCRGRKARADEFSAERRSQSRQGRRRVGPGDGQRDRQAL